MGNLFLQGGIVLSHLLPQGGKPLSHFDSQVAHLLGKPPFKLFLHKCQDVTPPFLFHLIEQLHQRRYSLISQFLAQYLGHGDQWHSLSPCR